MTIYKDVPILYTCSPNKLFDTFAAGRAAIVNTPGWLSELVEENEAGVAVRPADPADLADKVAFLRDNPELVRRYGENGRRLAEAEFDRDRLAARLEQVLTRAAAGLLMLLSYCVVNTNGRDDLLACLDAIERTHPEGVEHEVLVLDNASDDGSADGGARARRRASADRPRAADRQGRERLDAPARGAPAATACCSTRTPSSSPAPRGRSSTRWRPTPARRRRPRST